VDIGVAAGTQVKAAAAGRVTYAGVPARVYGPVVILEHGSGLHTVYSNLRDLAVTRGATVSAGQPLGSSGEKAVTPQPHLHFEVRRNGEAVDPLLYLPPR
jgi:murein DD-endopeptidase MepM/ murein hydrolase activator NlpD